MVVQHNLSAMNANRYLGINNSKLSKSLEKLSSGYAINRAGDNAAGLAVSEKMRSQIAGMTQGVKNAQDGISMVQTFEGAITETDSILQRMKTLADQMANGTYDDPVDRNAAQNEFDQLNDELNQIADTDFNGVICLNGGVMADGLEEVDGKFDYANADSQLQAKKDAINAKIAAEKAKTPGDITTKEDADGNKIMGADTDIDDTKYDGTAAENLWKDLGLDSTAKNVDIAFSATKAANGTVSYAATSGKVYDKDGNVIKELTAADLTKAGIAATAPTKTGATGQGGFSVKSTSNAGGMVNAVFDATEVDTGDMLTLSFTGPADKAKAPTNVGLADKYASGGTDDLAQYEYSNAASADEGATVTLGTSLNDGTMTEEINKLLTAIDGKEVTVTATASTAAPGALANIAIDGLTIGNDGTVKIGTEQVGFAAITAGVLTITSGENGTTAGATEILKIDMSKMFKGTADTKAGDTGKFTIVLDSYSYPDAGAAPDVNAKESEPDMTAINDAVAKLEEELAALDAEGVSVSNAHDNAAIPLTYTDNITLQTGARSKDAVKFTFKYSSEGGIGDLKNNMNCSARADGLNTENLSIATAKDANHAIDRIDHAINKVSMVRATFGAIQNRLEHKIDNLNVSIENLTSAESQIRDTNMPQEMMNFTKQQILAQASQSMLAQANQLPQGVLSLLQ